MYTLYYFHTYVTIQTEAQKWSIGIIIITGSDLVRIMQYTVHSQHIVLVWAQTKVNQESAIC